MFPQVSDVYLLVQQTVAQPLMKDYVPFSWASMVQVKAEHFGALSHYHAAVALCHHPRESPDSRRPPLHKPKHALTPVCATVLAEEEEEAFLHFYASVPAGPPLSQILRDPEKRRKLGESVCVRQDVCALNTHRVDPQFPVTRCVQGKLTCGER